jgi:hypothetical protein
VQNKRPRDTFTAAAVHLNFIICHRARATISMGQRDSLTAFIARVDINRFLMRFAFFARTRRSPMMIFALTSDDPIAADCALGT